MIDSLTILQAETGTGVTLLLTLTIVAVVELTAATRTTDHRVIYESAPSTKFPVHWRLLAIHGLNMLLLMVSLSYTEISIGNDPQSVGSIVLSVILIVLPLLEIREYDQFFLHGTGNQVGRLRGSSLSSIKDQLCNIGFSSFFVHALISLVYLSLLEIAPAWSIVAMLIAPFIGMFALGITLKWDLQATVATSRQYNRIKTRRNR